MKIIRSVIAAIAALSFVTAGFAQNYPSPTYKDVTIGGNLNLPSKSAGNVFAAPSGSAGAPTFRSIVGQDLPLSQIRSGAVSLGSTDNALSLYSNNTAKWLLGTSGTFYPAIDNTYTLGAPGFAASIGYINTLEAGTVRGTSAGAGPLAFQGSSVTANSPFIAPSVSNVTTANNWLQTYAYGTGVIAGLNSASNSVGLSGASRASDFNPAASASVAPIGVAGWAFADGIGGVAPPSAVWGGYFEARNYPTSPAYLHGTEIEATNLSGTVSPTLTPYAPIVPKLTSGIWLASGGSVSTAFPQPIPSQSLNATGSISGTTLTITAFTGDAVIAPGLVVVGTGVTAGTRITALGTGTGGNGTYIVNNSQTVTSRPLTFQSTGALDASVGMAVVNNGAKFKTGLLFSNTSIAGTDGLDGTGTYGNAIAMSRGQTVTWQNSSGITQTVSSAVTAAGRNQALLFTNEGLSLINNSGAPQFTVATGDTYVNGFVAGAGPSGTSPNLQAQGTDANISVVLTPKGSGSVVANGASMATNRNFINFSSPPTLSTCGTGGAVDALSSNSAGLITMGNAATCTVTFANAYANGAICTLSPSASIPAVGWQIFTGSPSGFIITLSGVATGQKFSYTCFGK